MEEAYSRLEAAVAAFGPFAIGQFPGAVFYRAGASRSAADFPAVNASAQDLWLCDVPLCADRGHQGA